MIPPANKDEQELELYKESFTIRGIRRKEILRTHVDQRTLTQYPRDDGVGKMKRKKDWHFVENLVQYC